MRNRVLYDVPEEPEGIPSNKVSRAGKTEETKPEELSVDLRIGFDRLKRAGCSV